MVLSRLSRNTFSERLDQNEGVLLSRVEVFFRTTEIRAEAVEVKASVDDAKRPPTVASPSS